MPSPLLGNELLGPGRLVPLAVDVLRCPDLGDLSVAGAAGEGLDNDGGEDQVGERNGMADEPGRGRSINEDLGILSIRPKDLEMEF